MLRYFQIKLFPNITTLFYRSQLHVPLYIRNTGWGSRYLELAILTPAPDFCFWNYKNFSYVSKKCSDIFESNCFLTLLLYFIRSQLHVPLYVRNTGWGSRYCGQGILTPTQFDKSEIRNVVTCQRRTPQYLDPHSVFLVLQLLKWGF